jgi:pimeloyl-ACP methyl ester carboxylesterase
LRHAGIGAAVVVLCSAGAIGSLAADQQSPRHLIYLHGRIVQQTQSARPQHPQYGFYELDKILDAFRDRGFVVSGEIRPTDESLNDSVDRVVSQVRRLLASGVGAGHVTVVGASMGGEIALLASAKLQNPEVRFCILGVCLSDSARRLVAETGKSPSGYLLSVREASDDLTRSCPAWKNDLETSSSIVAREIVLDTGLRHGFLYRPLPEWVDPVVGWASAEREQRATEPVRRGK